MSEAFVIHHVVSIAGCVRERPSTGTPPSAREREQRERRLEGALIEIVAGPPAFDVLRAGRTIDPARPGARPDRTYSQVDGIFFFTDLPSGTYRLHVSAPQYGSRFGVFDTQPIDVPPVPARVDVDLPSTRVRGVVVRSDTSEPVARALVRVRGDPQSVRTDDQGRYELRRLVRGSPTLEVMAPNLAPARTTVALTAGQEQVVDIQLDPLP
jgi:hypothetical protein